ncbi:MAG: hypothetical protein WCC84_17680 [Candidatus Cybelea sp.]
MFFSYAALEAFANEAITRAYANGFRYERKAKGGLVANFDLDAIERNL